MSRMAVEPSPTTKTTSPVVTDVLDPNAAGVPAIFVLTKLMPVAASSIHVSMTYTSSPDTRRTLDPYAPRKLVGNITHPSLVSTIADPTVTLRATPKRCARSERVTDGNTESVALARTSLINP